MDNWETTDALEPIAIIGMAGQFPGAKNVKQFWQNLCDGIESISFFTDEELLAAGVDPALLRNPNYVKANAVLADIELFDASFFGFTPREAKAMDPQHRLLLECAWNTLETAGYDPKTYEGRIGIYAGANMSTYLYSNLVSNPNLLADVDFDVIQQQDPISLGNDRDYLTTRISYKLGLNGPSINVNTACSTSLVAVHLANQSLLSYQCDMALAGAVSIQVPQKAGYLYREGGIASPDGHCRTFDAKAQGTLFCSGLGLVLLKRLEDALADGDYIYAVIKGSAINNDGASKVSYTAPSVDGQAAAIAEAQAVAEVAPETISYIEAHGTGTALGDPIEIAALTQVFRASTDKKGFCGIGSVKPNVGHLNRAAGMAGLVKTVLALKHKLIPPSINYEQPNPQIDFANSPFYVNTTLREWQTNGMPRLAGISSLGFGGTNAHAVLAEAPETETSSPSRPWQLLLISAKTDAALDAATQNLAEHLKQHPELNLADVAYTLQVGRRAFNHRRMLVCRNLDEALTALENPDLPGFFTKSPEFSERPVVFMFSGQGAQYVNMALELYQIEPTFRDQIDLCADILQPHLELDLRHVLYPTEEQADEALTQLKQTAITQPALFVIEYALAKLWESWGVRPQAMIGHSIGGYVAACLAGVFSLEDALSLVAARGKMMQQLPQGAMLAVPLSEEEVQPFLGQGISLALINGTSRCVMSGTTEAVEALEKQLAEQGIEGRRLHTSHAFHSEMMEPILEPFIERVKQVTLKPPQIPYVSNVTGTWITAEEATDPNYWARHLRQTVRFSSGLQQLFQESEQLLLEVGPGRTLSTLALQHPDKAVEQVVLTSVRHPKQTQSDLAFLLNTLGKLWGAGVEVDWSGFYANERRHRLPLPTYPFERKRYWVEANEASNYKKRLLSSTHSRILHPLLGQQLHLAGTQEIHFESQISQDLPAFLKHHCVYQTTILPATAYIEMALAAGVVVFKSENLVLEEVLIQRALILPEDEVKTLQLILTSEGTLAYSFQIFSLIEDDSESSWTLHASGKVLVDNPEQEPARAELTALQNNITEQISIEDYYQQFQEYSMDYGSSFQAIEQLWRHEREALGQIRLPEALVLDAGDYKLHPVLLDACFQVLVTAIPEAGKDKPWVPVSLDRLQVYRRPSNCLWSHAQIRSVKDSNDQTISSEVHLFTPDGQLIAEVEGLLLKKASREALLSNKQESLQNWFYEVEWRPMVRFVSQQLPPDYLSTPSAIRECLLPQLSELTAQPDLEEHGKALCQLELLSVAYVLKAFEEMTWDVKLGQRFSTAVIAKQLGVVSLHLRLLERLLEMLTEVGLLRRTGEQWEVSRKPEIPNPQEEMNRLLSQYPAAKTELTMVGRCGSKMAQVLRGECDPLQLLFPEGDLTTATQLYQDAPGARVMNVLVQKVVLSALEHLPKGRGVRVLEIGGGTGGTTSYLLPHLEPHQTEYVFTDLGRLFLTQAREKFRDYPFVQYQVLDIEKPPEAQGFDLHQFDLIVAANVLHATSDLRQTLRHVQQLLTPGGMLVLLEVTVPQRWVDLIFGITEGWWRFTDYDLRSNCPLVSAAQWQKVLLELGFEDAVTIPSEPEAQGVLSQQTVIVTKKAQVKSESARSEPKNWLIFADGQGMGQELGKLLQSKGEGCILVFPGKDYQKLSEQEFRINPASKADFQQLLKAVGTNQTPLHGVVHLWSLNAVEARALTSLDLEEASKQGCGSTLHLVQSLVCGFSAPPSLWLVTRGAAPVGGEPNVPGVAQSALWGMGKVIALEHPELNCVRVDLDPDAQKHEAKVLFEEIWSETTEDEVAFRDQIRHVAKLVRINQTKESLVQDRLEVPQSQSFQLGTSARGILDNLELQPKTRCQPSADEVEIRVYATGLNFRDVLNALGLYPGDPGLLGCECAGKVVAIGEEVEGFEIGESVVAIAPGSFSQYVTVKAATVVSKPEALSFEEAATIPVAFLTAYYTLHHLAHISPGDRVLIHAATGGVGQAAVQLAQQAGAEVLGTASPGKWEFLKSLGVKHIMNSRTLDFAEEVMAITEGQGVDIVLNSLSGDFIPKSISVLSAEGRFLEIGKRGVWDASQVSQVKPRASYFLVDLMQVCQQQPALIQPMLRQLMQQFQEGKLKPLAQKVFPIQEAVSAFRYMQQAKHIGKIVVSLGLEIVNLAEQKPITFERNSTYLITGGTGGLGLLMARWMVEKGARHLILVGRSGASSAISSQLRELEQAGAEVVVAKADVSELEQVAQVLKEIVQSQPPLRGIIHAVGVLDDGILRQQNWERFAKVMNPKVAGAWNLHTLTQHLPLDFFVMFSSVVSLLGNGGQANHAAANAFLDALAYYRQAQGLPGLSINWGPWSDIGAAAKRQVGHRMSTTGMGTISPQQGLQAMEELLRRDAAQVGVMPVNWFEFLDQFPANTYPALFSDLADQVRQKKVEQKQGSDTNLKDQLNEASSDERRKLLVEYLQQQVKKLLGFDASSPLESNQLLSELGLDSLVSIQLRNRLRTELNVDLPIDKFLESTIVQLGNALLEKLALANIILSEAPSTDLGEDMEEITL